MFGHLIVMTINRFELILDKDSNDYYIAGEEIKVFFLLKFFFVLIIFFINKGYN